MFLQGRKNKWTGIINLVKAFNLLESDCAELHICGMGHMPGLTSLIKANQNIIYHGLVSDERLNEICSMADIFVNPRPINISGTRYNFPSKLLEYMAYNRPIISTWTEGLDPIYREVLLVTKDDSPGEIANLMKQVIDLPIHTIKSNCEKLELFVKTHKKSSIQANRFIDWLTQMVIKKRL